MASALHRLAVKGVLTRAGGRGHGCEAQRWRLMGRWVGRPAAPPPEVPRVPLQLAADAGVHRRTCRRHLKALAADKLVQRHGRGWVRTTGRTRERLDAIALREGTAGRHARILARFALERAAWNRHLAGLGAVVLHHGHSGGVGISARTGEVVPLRPRAPGWSTVLAA